MSNIFLAPFRLIGVAYHLFFYQPLLNALVFLYDKVAFHDLGFAIILLTLLIRIILFPLFQKSTTHQIKMQTIQPKLKQIQTEHKGNYQKQSEAMMRLYQEHGVNPMSGIGLLLIQLPILIALYRIFLGIFDPEIMKDLYPFISSPGDLQPMLFGLINLANRNIVMVILAAIAQYFQGKLAMPATQGQDAASQMGRQMVFMAPVFTLIIFMNLPAAVSLYWIVTSIFSIGQQMFINSQLKNGKLE